MWFWPSLTPRRTATLGHHHHRRRRHHPHHPASSVSRAHGPCRVGAQVGKQSGGAFKTNRVVPTLKPSGHVLYKKLYKQLGANWVDDAAAPACMACARQFTEVYRRHHCRLLGIVVCGDCSAKRAVLPGLQASAVRVCDAAFNVVLLLAAEGEAAASNEKKVSSAARQMAEVEAAEAEAERKAFGTLPPKQAAERNELLGGGGGGGAPRGSASAGSSGAQRGGAKCGAAGAMGEAMNALNERGEKLNSLGNKVDDLGREAEDFASMATQIRKNAERNAGWF